MSLTSWFLVSSGGTRHRLPREMIFVGRDDCELMLQSRSVDKQHAVINYEPASDEHKVKDLGSLNGTFVNDVRIQEQMYITLKIDDKLRFGYDIFFNAPAITVCHTRVKCTSQFGELHVPEEALKHEKFTSQLQLGKKLVCTESPKTAKSPTAKGAESKAAEPIPVTEAPAKVAENSKTDEKMPDALCGGLDHVFSKTEGLGEHHGQTRGWSYVVSKDWARSGTLRRHSGAEQRPRWDSRPEQHPWRDSEVERHPWRDSAAERRPRRDSVAERHLGGTRAEQRPRRDSGVEQNPQRDSEVERHPCERGWDTVHRQIILSEIRVRGKIILSVSGGTATDYSVRNLAGDTAALHRGTPLYGQPSWWGDGDADDENSFKQENKAAGKKQETPGTDTKETKRTEKAKENGVSAAGPEPSYFEIPSKDGQMSEDRIHEVPTKDTESSAAAKAAQANTSFTIEFDNTSPGKVTIKDHVSRPRSKKSQPGSKELSSLQAAIMASESKVADWLAHNNPPIVRRESTEDDSKSIKSDVPVHLKRLKGSKHEDGTQSDSENGLGLRFGSRRHAALEERLKAAGLTRAKVTGAEGSGSTSRTAFTIEFFDEENPRKRRSYSFSQTAPLLGGMVGEGLCPAPPSHPKGTSSVLATVAPTAARLLQKKRSEEKTTTPVDETQKQDDEQSDKGTYTIELENHNPEEEEARRMIDKVFGVKNPPDPGCTAHQKTKDSKKASSTKAEGLLVESVAVGSPHWVSQWATLAANHTRTDPEGSGAEPTHFVHQEREAETFESGVSLRSTGSATSSQAERKRRTLPQLPTEEKSRLGKSTPSTGLRSEIGEKQDTELQEKQHKGDGECVSTPSKKDATTSGKTNQVQMASSKPPVPPVGDVEKQSEDARRRRAEDRSKGSDGERSGKPLVRQGSFTIDKPSANVPLELIPRINQRQSGGRERSDSAGSMDTATLLKDTEAVMAFLEAKLRDEKKLDPSPPPGYPLGRSFSPELGSDTTKATGRTEVPQKRRSLSSMHREKSNMSSAGKSTTNARERLERKAKPKTSDGRLDTRRSSHTSQRARQPSMDLTDDEQTSSLPISDVLSDDQENGRNPFTFTDDLLHSKLDSSKVTRASKSNRTPQASTTPIGKPQLPQPRPTRASLLRRARLGDTSDTDLADADRVSVASEVSTTSSTSRPPSGRKAPSRLDMLAQPRRTRLGSMSARSDSEATISRSTTSRISSETALRLGLRPTNPADSKLNPRLRANSVSKLTDTKSKTTPSITSAPAASSRWRRLNTEYGSTSEDEFGSNRNSPKAGRLRPGTALRTSRLSSSSAVTTSPGTITIKHRMREQEEYIRDWTAHSEEIARISQDLAKDLAILAREIHDVAGEIDSVSSSGTAPSTTVSTAATTPGSAIDTREELVERVFDESLNFRKIPPVVQTKTPEINGRPVELRPRAPDSLDPQNALRRRTWNRDEVRPAVLDSLLLTSVSQLSSKIRQSVDKTAGKIKILFKDKDRNWDDIESKLSTESDIPLLKTTNKEIATILTELKRVEKQIQAINIMVDPDGTLDALTSLSLVSPTTPKPKASNGASKPSSAISPNREILSPGLSRPQASGEASTITNK
ncbi:centrosomal protein of 170 kDa isoform X5 [Silurus meridionalis]|nr:centrosomal protein of 170 kDa isoform X5 [Silurus meridionalis]